MMIKVFGCLVALWFMPSLAVAQEPASAAGCVACHGQAGRSVNPEWPNLAGQKAGYLLRQLRAFKSGDRQNLLMEPIIAGLTDADMMELAEYFSSLDSVVSANGDSALVNRGRNRAGYCVGCHGMWGETVNAEWPNIGGQHAPYLEKQMAAFHGGARVNGLMQNIIKDIPTSDFAALAAYFSQLSR